jgi:hypothetical protein
MIVSDRAFPPGDTQRIYPNSGYATVHGHRADDPGSIAYAGVSGGASASADCEASHLWA